VYSRAEDRSFWTRTSATLEKYKLLMWVLFGIIASAGFGFRTPIQTFNQIHADIDTLQIRQRTASAERSALEAKLDALIRMECYRAARDKLEMDAVLAGLNCKQGVP
jgi:hypothetical protein